MNSLCHDLAPVLIAAHTSRTSKRSCCCCCSALVPSYTSQGWQGAPEETHWSMKASRMFPSPPNLSRAGLGRAGWWLEKAGQCYRGTWVCSAPLLLWSLFCGKIGTIKWNSLPADGGMSACCKASKMHPHLNEGVALFITVNLGRITQHFWFHVPLPTVAQQGQNQNLHPCCIYGWQLCLVWNTHQVWLPVSCVCCGTSLFPLS